MNALQDVLDLTEKWRGQRNKIVDIYNSHAPLARGYKVKYEDALCATYVSALFIELGLTELVPPECGAMQLMRNMQALGRWASPREHEPRPGDLIFFDWHGDGWADHVGIVTEVGARIVKYSHIPSYGVTVNETYKTSGAILGYGCPAYEEAGGPSGATAPTDERDESSASAAIRAGDWVTVKPGARWYNGSTIRPFVFEKTWQVIQVNGDRAVLGMDKDEVYNIQSPIHVEDLVKAESTAQTAQETEMVAVTVTIPRSVYARYGSPEAVAAALAKD